MPAVMPALAQHAIHSSCREGRCVRPAAIVFVLLLAVLPVGCGGPGRVGSLETNTTITQEELAQLDVATAYQAVERLRPDFLRSRGPVSVRNPRMTLPAVYVAGIRQQGGPDALRHVRLGDVREIQYLNSSDATTRYGTDHAGGAIIVVLR